MTADRTDRPDCVYAVLEPRAGACPRIVQEFCDPVAAKRAAAMLRWAGSPAYATRISRIDGTDPEPLL